MKKTIKAIPKHLFSWCFRILEQGKEIAEIDVRWIREAGEVFIGGKPYRVYREGLMSGAFVLEEKGSVIARAFKPSALYRSFRVEFEGREFVLKAASAFRRTFVFQEKGRTIGTIAPQHALSRKAVVDLPLELPLPFRIYLVWLVIVLWKRQAQAASSC